MKTRIYRKDYKPCNYLIKTTNLAFEFFDDDSVMITSILNFYQNINADKADELFLNGENLEFISIDIDGKSPNYQLSDDGILLKNLAEKFVLTTKVKIYPAKNTALTGLYKSGKKNKQMFCTQCEAHGFRNITYYLDRPDILSIWNVKIIANSSKYPTQLSNGNFKNGWWCDPHPKPCYLFALVVGDLALNKEKYADIELEIWTEKHNQNKTAFAMQSLKNAIKWESVRFNLKYDLQKYMIVAVDDFNMGAMENKGLNIFNSALVLASPQTTTDKNYLDIEAVIGHEYFHNWTGNRITCRDWFQLSLKEGLTVFRDQEFSSDLRNRDIKRIEDAYYLRTYQFSEDSSSLSHPVRPESYIAMDNFYTLTVYEKGAEIVRMIWTILGEDGFQNLMQKYIKNFDGRAVTIDDFISCADLKNEQQFKIWYEKAGTPKVSIKQNASKITISQDDNRITPIKYGILDKNGKEISAGILLLNAKFSEFDFSSFGDDLHFSWLRDFSAPVILEDNLTIKQRIFLVINDKNAFVHFDNMQKLMFLAILEDNDSIFIAFDYLIASENDNAILAKLLKIPSEKDIYATLEIIDVAEIHQKLNNFKHKIATKYIDFFQQKYQELMSDYEFNTAAIYQRELKNLCLEYLGISGNFDNAYRQFKNPNCGTDMLAAFNILLTSNAFRDEVIDSFYTEFSDDNLMLNKWFATVASSEKTTYKDIEKLLNHPSFSLKNPNKVRNLIGGFVSNNINFHTKNGYEILANVIIKLSNINPQIGARLATNFSSYNKFSDEYKNQQLRQITRIKTSKNLSANIFEIINS